MSVSPNIKINSQDSLSAQAIVASSDTLQKSWFIVQRRLEANQKEMQAMAMVVT
jgi:hypothetical protein